MSALSSKDLMAILDVVAELPVGIDEELTALAACVGLQRLVPCDELGYSILDRDKRRIIAYVSPVHDDGGGDETTFWSIEPDHPLCRAGYPVCLLSEQVGPRALHASRVYAEWYTPLAINDEAKLELGRHGGVSRTFMFSRSGSGRFSRRDREVLEVIRPHLVRLFSPPSASTVLTRREQEILTAVGRGMSNKEIARQLAISSGTVRKHLENIFAKLGVHSRTAAIATTAPVLPTVSPPPSWRSDWPPGDRLM
jgi:DNA-binding CsgD family transcriptional regulator